MRTRHEVANQLRQRFDREYPNWARGRGTWPLKVNLQPPTTAERLHDPVACHTWADEWGSYAGPGTVETQNVRFPTGIHPMPRNLSFTSPGAVAAVNTDTQETWRQCGIRLTELERTFPRASFERIIRRITELADQDYRRMVSTTRWLLENPTSGMMLRQLPIEGIHTKWLAQHATLLLALLGDDSAADVDGTDSQRIQLHKRLGLRVPPHLIQVGILDPDLRAQVADMRHFAASVDDLNRWPRIPNTVVIMENKETGYAMVNDHPGTVVLHGLGFSVAHYARITWVRNASTVIYWGDIDLPGLAFVSDLRRLGIDVHTILMDLDTLDRFRHLAVNGATVRRLELDLLTRSERELHEHLTDHATRNDTGLLLEQERIEWSHAYMALAKAIGS